MRILLALCLAGTLALADLQSSAAATQPTGVVLLHGKTGTPNQFTKLSAALAAAGFAVAPPEMCWSKKRIFDEAFDDCMKEVDAARHAPEGERSG
jgi:dienelactone hydrolase